MSEQIKATAPAVEQHEPTKLGWLDLETDIQIAIMDAEADRIRSIYEAISEAVDEGYPKAELRRFFMTLRGDAHKSEILQFAGYDDEGLLWDILMAIFPDEEE